MSEQEVWYDPIKNLREDRGGGKMRERDKQKDR